MRRHRCRRFRSWWERLRWRCRLGPRLGGLVRVRGGGDYRGNGTRLGLLTAGYRFRGPKDVISQPPQTTDEVVVTVSRYEVEVGGAGVASLRTIVSVLGRVSFT